MNRSQCGKSVCVRLVCVCAFEFDLQKIEQFHFHFTFDCKCVDNHLNEYELKKKENKKR